MSKIQYDLLMQDLITLSNSTFWMYSCRDGRIKIIGGDNIEGLLISPKKLPYKNLEVIKPGKVLGQIFISFMFFNLSIIVV